MYNLGSGAIISGLMFHIMTNLYLQLGHLSESSTISYFKENGLINVT